MCHSSEYHETLGTEKKKSFELVVYLSSQDLSKVPSLNKLLLTHAGISKMILSKSIKHRNMHFTKQHFDTIKASLREEMGSKND